MPPGLPQFPYLSEIVAFLVATVIIVPVFNRLRWSPVIGFLVVGIAIGPNGFGIVAEEEGVRRLAELGIVFLLFTIGLELTLERLWALRRWVFGLGALQVGLSALVIGGIARWWENSPEASIVLGMSFALSSTAIVMQLITERGAFASRLGRTAFSILLLQDLAVVPILFLITVMGTPNDGSVLVQLGAALGRAILAVAGIFVLGRLLLRPLFRVVAGNRSREFFMGMTLLAILGTAWGTSQAGLSMALGAFLAGLLLSETEFRHQIEIDIQPFRGLLLGLFFISVGMGIDLAAVADEVDMILLSVLGLLLIKSAILVPLGLLFRLPRETAVELGLLLGGGGEFALLAVGQAMVFGLLPGDVGQFMLIVTSMSIALTPLVAAGARWFAGHIVAREATATPQYTARDMGELADHVIIAGFGRAGNTVARLLDRQKVPYVALETNAQRIAECRGRKLPVFYGDASHPEVVRRLGPERAAAFIVTLDDPEAAARTVSNVAAIWPDLPVYARARDARHAEDLARRGAWVVVPETFEMGLRLGGEILNALGTPVDAVTQIVDEERRGHEYGTEEDVVDGAG